MNQVHRTMNDLKNKSIFEWPKEIRSILKKKIEFYIQKEYASLFQHIQGIYVTGSRTYKYKNKIFFVENSDLDIIIIISNKKTYIEECKKRNIKINYSYQKENLKFSFIFNKVQCNCYIFPPDYPLDDFNGYDLPFLEIETLVSLKGNIYEALYFLHNCKGRFNPTNFCMICDTEKECRFRFDYRITDSYDKSKPIPTRVIGICEECYSKIFSKDKSLIDILKYISEKGD